jgi:hypothetical protein
MWDHRNYILHNEGETIHRHELKALDIEIREEMRVGLNGLYIKYRHMFQGPLYSKLETTMQKKRMWIMNVWAA